MLCLKQYITDLCETTNNFNAKIVDKMRVGIVVFKYVNK